MADAGRAQVMLEAVDGCPRPWSRGSTATRWAAARGWWRAPTSRSPPTTRGSAFTRGTARPDPGDDLPLRPARARARPDAGPVHDGPGLRRRRGVAAGSRPRGRAGRGAGRGATADWVDGLLAVGPEAIAECKRLVRDASAALALPDLAARIARARASDEGQEGVTRVPREAKAEMGELSRILIANRGEIAVRVIRACRELGIEAGRRHHAGRGRRAARPSWPTTRSTVASLPRREALVAAARDAGADAVHPGYGFLAENPAFAEQRAPPPGMTSSARRRDAMRLLGDKVEARRLAAAAGVPVVPGYAGIDLATRRGARGGAARVPRCWSRPRPAAAAAACAPCDEPERPRRRDRRGPPRGRGRVRRRPRVPRALAGGRAPRRGAGARRRPWATASTWASATARCSAATRR